VAEEGIEGVADEIDGENSDGEAASPLGTFGQADRGQSAGGADDGHERDGPVADLLKLHSRFRLESPDWFEETSGKCERDHRDQADHGARGEEDDEQGDPERSRPRGGFHFQ
jgi:hypothetical protein